jgi:hypothetical protein
MADYNSSLPVRTETAGDVIVKVSDATVTSQQLKVNADGSIDTNFAPGAAIEITDGTDTLAINGDGSINITDNGGSITVDGTVTVTATNLDIRDLTHVSDSVKIGDGTDFLAVATDGSIAVTDNGGSLTVDGTVTVTATDLDIRNLSAAQDNVRISDGTDSLAVNTDGSINITDNGGSITVDGTVAVTATDLDIRDLSAATDSVTARIVDEAGTAFSTTNPLAVTIVDKEGAVEVCNYDTTASVAGGASDNHVFTTTATTKLSQIEASASGKLKIEVQTENTAGGGVYTTRFVGFNSTSNPNISFKLEEPITVVNGAIIRVIRTNRDNQSQDVYSTILGYTV